MSQTADKEKIEKIQAIMKESMATVGDFIGEPFTKQNGNEIHRLIHNSICSRLPKFDEAFELKSDPNNNSSRSVLRFAVIDKETGMELSMDEVVDRYNYIFGEETPLAIK